MMLPSHLLAAVALALLLGLLRGRPFSAREWGLALAFGVAIDLDHALAFPAYLAANGAAALDPVTGLQYGAAWQGFMHTPWALAVVLPAMWWWRSLWPAVFWGLHMWADFVVARHYVVFGSLHEWAIVGALVLVVWLLAMVQRVVLRGRSEAPYAAYATTTNIWR